MYEVTIWIESFIWNSPYNLIHNQLTTKNKSNSCSLIQPFISFISRNEFIVIAEWKATISLEMHGVLLNRNKLKHDDRNPRFFPNYGYADPLSSLRSCHLDIKDAQCDTKKLGVKYHFTSCRVWVLRSFKSGVLGSQQFNFFQNWPNL